MAYTKLDKSILYSSIWDESDQVRILWITMLSACDKNGFVSAAVPGLSNAARLSIPKTEKALAVLMAPDPNDKSGVDEGRRVRKIEGGFEIVNYEHYCNLNNHERTKLLARERQRRRRAGLTKSCHGVCVTKRDKRDSNDCHDNETETETESESEKKVPSPTPPKGGAKKKKARKRVGPNKPEAYEELRAYGLEIGLPRDECMGCWDWWESAGWIRKAGPVRDWKATVRSWKDNWKKKLNKGPTLQAQSVEAIKHTTDNTDAELNRILKNDND
jgi:hypothetical protein